MGGWFINPMRSSTENSKEKTPIGFNHVNQTINIRIFIRTNPSNFLWKFVCIKGKDSNHPTDPMPNVHRLSYAPRAHVSLHHHSNFSFLSPTNRSHPHLSFPTSSSTSTASNQTLLLRHPRPSSSPPSSFPSFLCEARHYRSTVSPSWRSTGVDRHGCRFLKVSYKRRYRMQQQFL